MVEGWRELIDDLEAERRVLESALRRIDDGTWDRPSPADGWSLRDCVAHLAESDESAVRSIERYLEEQALGVTPAQRNAPAARREGVLTPGQARARSLPPSDMLDWYARANDGLLDALRRLRGNERLLWAGRPIGARSFTSARLMEHWSHGLDILDAAGVQAVDSDRLRHVAHLGYITRDFAYRNRGLNPPETPLRVELIAPSGTSWSWGPDDAPDRISGPAGDFCRVVTQRIHPEDTALVCEGPTAREFLFVAQAFAGPPGPGRPRRSQEG
jgi:uncharacterized protein (TIGR03084 family)